MGTPEAPRWVVADVCEVLGLGRTNDAVAGLDGDEKGTDTIRTPGGPQEMLTVTEPGL
jgi:prophage antirepressor-like protein